MLGVIPLIVALFILRQRLRRKRMTAFAEKRMIPRLQPDLSRRRPALKLTLICLALAFLIIALANPLGESNSAEGERSGIDMAVCIDVSNSMLAEDMSPNRMERAKMMVKELMNQLGGDRISLVVFAGKAYVEMPLTNDYGVTKMFLDQIGTEMVSLQGTAIGDAIEKGMSTLGYGNKGNKKEPEWEPNRSRAIVIISDGENHEDDARKAASKAAEQGVMVCAVGIGSSNGSQIPVYDQKGNKIGPRKDNEGHVVTTRLNEQMLTDVANAGNGIYVHADNIKSATESIIKQLSTLEKQKFGNAMFSTRNSEYQYPLAAAIVCLLLEVFIFERRNPRINLNKMIRRKSK